MNSGEGLPEDRHQAGVGRVSAREFHIVSQFVRRSALQHQLTGIGIFAFISLKRYLHQMNPREDDGGKNERQQTPPCQQQSSIMNVDLV